MGLIATIHTTDIDQMAELVAAARSHGPIEVCYVAGGLELHRVAGHQAEPEPAAPAASAAPAAKRAPAPKKTPAKPARTGTFRDNPPTRTPEKTPDPCPHCGRQFRIAAGRQRHIDTCSGTVTTFTTDTPIARGPIDHDAARTRAAQAI